MSDNDSGRIRKIYLWGIPLSVFVATWLYWPLVQGAGLAFPLYVLSIPFIFANVVIRTATRHLHLWSVNRPLTHWALMWSTYSALGILIASDTIAGPFTAVMVVKSAVFGGLLGAGIGTLVDVTGIDEGILVLQYCSMDRGTVRTVLSFAFKFFGLFGAIFGTLTKVGYWFLVQQGHTRWLPALILSASAVLCLPYMVHFLLGARTPVEGSNPSLSARP
jgi:hypothetical protein